MTTYTQKLRASIAYNTDDCYLNCDVPGIPALKLSGPSKLDVRVKGISMEAHGALVFFMAPNSGYHCPRLQPSEEHCRIALEWINTNFDKLFPEQEK